MDPDPVWDLRGAHHALVWAPYTHHLPVPTSTSLYVECTSIPWPQA